MIHRAPVPIAALDAIEATSRVRVVVTRVDFGEGKLNGAALARMLRVKLLGVDIGLRHPARRSGSIVPALHHRVVLAKLMQIRGRLKLPDVASIITGRELVW